MDNYIKVIDNGKEKYLNDILVDLPYSGGKDFDVEVEGVTFTLSPDDAHEFCMDYSQDTYSQQVSPAGKSLKGLREFCRNTACATERK